MDQELEEVMACTGLRMRRATRLITQIYDQALQPTGITINQFGLLAHLYGASLASAGGLPLGALAQRVDMDPTTLNRSLKPLEARGLVRDSSDPGDGRVRLLRLTAKGLAEWRKAIPYWRQAQKRVEQAIGAKPLHALNELLDLSAEKLAPLG
jgi:DNA-binding MarR family transcriptional regulator